MDKLFPTVFAPLCIPTSNVYGFRFLYILFRHPLFSHQFDCGQLSACEVVSTSVCLWSAFL